MIGAGTMRAERYGHPVSDPGKRELRQSLGLAPDPLTVIVSGSLQLPWDAPLFGEDGGPVLLFTSSEREPPETAVPVSVVRHDGAVDLVEALRHLRQETGLRAVLCEGGPRLHAETQDAGLVDEIFLTVSPKLTGGAAPRILEGKLAQIEELELAWLLEEEGELFARYRRAE
jgi:riboflavin biosynthesis pyrimidine reductase